MNKRPMDGTHILVFGAILLCLGLNLLYEAHHVGPAGQVMIKMSKVDTDAVSARTAANIGICMVLPGIVLTVYAFKRGVRVFGTSCPLPSWPLMVGMLVFLALMVASWQFFLRTIQ